MQKITTVISKNPYKFQNMINFLFLDGWKLHGEPCISNKQDKFTIDQQIVYNFEGIQILKKEFKKENPFTVPPDIFLCLAVESSYLTHNAGCFLCGAKYRNLREQKKVENNEWEGPFNPKLRSTSFYIRSEDKCWLEYQIKGTFSSVQEYISEFILSACDEHEKDLDTIIASLKYGNILSDYFFKRG